MDVVINYWAVLACTLLAVGIGSLWYGPLFGKQWMRIIGIAMPGEITKAIKREMMKAYGIQMLASFGMAFVLAHFLQFAGAFMEAEGVLAAATGAIWVWVGFVVPVTLTSVLWENRPWRYWFITAGYFLVTLVLMSVLLSVWA